MPPPQIQSSKIFHFVFDKKFKTDAFYIANYDPNFKSFRISLYPNYAGREDSEKGFRASVEVICQPEQLSDVSEEDIKKELVEMGVVEANAQVTFSSERVAKAGFPVPTNDLVFHRFVFDWHRVVCLSRPLAKIDGVRAPVQQASA